MPYHLQLITRATRSETASFGSLERFFMHRKLYLYHLLSSASGRSLTCPATTSILRLFEDAIITHHKQYGDSFSSLFQMKGQSSCPVVFFVVFLLGFKGWDFL